MGEEVRVLRPRRTLMPTAAFGDGGRAASRGTQGPPAAGHGEGQTLEHLERPEEPTP